MIKDRGVSIKVSEDFYRMMEKTRLNLINRYQIKISSHIKLTKLMAQNINLFKNKQWINQIKNGIKK